MSQSPAKQITIHVRVRIDVRPGIEPVGVLDLALDKMSDALDQYSNRNSDEVTDARMNCDIRNAEITDIEE
jgi:hypothetical protein